MSIVGRAKAIAVGASLVVIGMAMQSRIEIPTDRAELSGKIPYAVKSATLPMNDCRSERENSFPRRKRQNRKTTKSRTFREKPFATRAFTIDGKTIKAAADTARILAIGCLCALSRCSSDIVRGIPLR